MASQLVIYDGDCAYCRGFVQLIRILDRKRRISALCFDAPAAQALLRAQFGENYGFAMYLFEACEVSWSREAARRIVENISLPRWMVWMTFHVYPSLVRLVTKLTRRRRRVCGPDCIEQANLSLRKQFAKIQNGALRQLQSILH